MIHPGWAHKDLSNLSLLNAAHKDTRDSVLLTVELKSRKLNVHNYFYDMTQFGMLFNSKLLADVKLNFEKEESAEILTQWLWMFSRG